VAAVAVEEHGRGGRDARAHAPAEVRRDAGRDGLVAPVGVEAGQIEAEPLGSFVRNFAKTCV
jgi:hypothetical protein